MPRTFQDARGRGRIGLRWCLSPSPCCLDTPCTAPMSGCCSARPSWFYSGGRYCPKHFSTFVPASFRLFALRLLLPICCVVDLAFRGRSALTHLFLVPTVLQ